MSIWVSLAIVGLGICLILSILRAVAQKKISESHGILWMIPGIIVVFGGIFPDAVVHLAKLLHVSYAPTLAFTFAILIAYYILFWCTLWIGKLTARMQELSMQVTLLNQENELLRKEMDALGSGAENERPA